MTLKGLFTGD